MAIKDYVKDGKKLSSVYVDGTNSAGKRIQFTKRGILTLRQAQNVEFEFKCELSKIKDQKLTYTFDEWYRVCIERMNHELLRSTVIGYESQIEKWVNPHWKNLEITKIVKAEVYDLVFNKCDEINTQRTRLNLLKRIKRIFQMAVEEGIIDRNPALGIKIKVGETEQEVLTTTEVDIFLREAKRCNHRFYPVWVVALMTGMRSGEMYALKWTDVDFEGRTISVTKAWSSKIKENDGIGDTKTKRHRIVPISDDLFQFLRETKLKTGASSEYVLPRLGEWAHGEQADVTRDFCEAVGITSVKFHDLRATFITNLLARGETLARVMSIVGHTELKTTNGYLRKAGVDVKGGTDKLGYKLPQEADATVLKLVKKS